MNGKRTQEARQKTRAEPERRVKQRARQLLHTISTLRVKLVEHRRMERQLRESLQQYRLLFEKAPYPMLIFDLETLAFLAVNEAAVRHYGYAREEFLCMTIKDIRPPEDVPRLLRYLPTVQTSPTTEITWRHQKKNGAIIDVEVAFHTFTFSRRPARLMVVSDITERKRSEVLRSQLLNKIISVQEDERRRFARDLHDEIGQTLTSLLVGLRAMEGMPSLEGIRAQGREIRQDVVRALKEIQRMAAGLRPGLLDDLGLDAALRRYAAEYSRAHGIATDIHLRGLEGSRLPIAVETSLYRIVQEALTNAAKHAAAKTVSILVHRTRSYVQVIVEDDGRGFLVDAVPPPTSEGSHLGLQGIRERVALLNGALSIESSLGKGTTIYVWTPVKDTMA